MRTHEFGRKPAIYLGIFLLGNLLHASAAGPGGGGFPGPPKPKGRFRRGGNTKVARYTPGMKRRDSCWSDGVWEG